MVEPAANPDARRLRAELGQECRGALVACRRRARRRPAFRTASRDRSARRERQRLSGVPDRASSTTHRAKWPARDRWHRRSSVHIARWHPWRGREEVDPSRPSRIPDHRDRGSLAGRRPPANGASESACSSPPTRNAKRTTIRPPPRVLCPMAAAASGPLAPTHDRDRDRGVDDQGLHSSSHLELAARSISVRLGVPAPDPTIPYRSGRHRARTPCLASPRRVPSGDRTPRSAAPPAPPDRGPAAAPPRPRSDRQGVDGRARQDPLARPRASRISQALAHIHRRHRFSCCL